MSTSRTELEKLAKQFVAAATKAEAKLGVKEVKTIKK